MTNQLASLAGRDYFYLDAFWRVNLGMYIIIWITFQTMRSSCLMFVAAVCILFLVDLYDMLSTCEGNELQLRLEIAVRLLTLHMLNLLEKTRF